MTARLKVKVVPGARRTKVVGWLGDELKIAVAAPPEGGKANAAVCAVLAEFLGLPAAAVAVESGHTRPRKLLTLQGLTPDTLREALARHNL